MNPTAQSAPPIPTPSVRLRMLPWLALAVLATAAAGCGQEGKTVQAVLPVQAIAFDASSVVDSTVNDTILTVSFDVKMKLQTTYLNGCEARGGLELRAEVQGDTTLYVLTPVARYTADESCNIGISGDTLQTLTIKGLTQTRTHVLPDSIIVQRFEVRGFGAPPIRFAVDVGTASVGDTATTYVVRVEDKDTGAPLDGANVRVERYGTPDVLSEGPSAGGGRYVFDVACPGTDGTPAAPYVVKVSYSGRITVFRVAQHPSLCKRRESIIVRV